MPSWQSYVVNPLLRIQVKRKLAKARTAADVRVAFGSALPAPKGAAYRPDNIGGVAGEWAEAAAPAKVAMLYLHGGGYMACSPQTHRAITGSFAKRGLKVFTPDYRLAPEHPFPAAVDDALAVYRAMVDGGDGLVVAGDSAGGGLALALLLAVKAAGLPMPAAAMVFFTLDGPGDYRGEHHYQCETRFHAGGQHDGGWGGDVSERGGSEKPARLAALW